MQIKKYTGLDNVWLQTRKGVGINPRGNQKRYVQRILQSDISFGIGPAGKVKPILCCCRRSRYAFERNEIQRILLVRPAVEVRKTNLFTR